MLSFIQADSVDVVTISWSAIGVLITATAAIMGLGVAYLRMFVSQQLLEVSASLREAILESVQEGYLPKPKGEVYDLKLESIERRVGVLEQKVRS